MVDIDSILQQALDAKSKVDPGGLARAKNRSQMRRVIAPKIGQLNACCKDCESSDEPLGPYRVGQYNPSLDAWDATCINTGFQFYGRPLNNGAMGTGDVLMGLPGSPGGLFNPRKAKDTPKPKQPTTLEKFIEIIIKIGYTGKL